MLEVADPELSILGKCLDLFNLVSGMLMVGGDGAVKVLAVLGNDGLESVLKIQ